MSMGMREETYNHIMKYLHTLDLDTENGIILNRKTKKTDDWGYYRIMLANKVVKYHQIFAVARWGKKCIGMTVNHINEIKTDNSWSNLELLTNEENASLNKGGRKGKHIKSINVNTREERMFESINEACRQLNLPPTSVRRVLDGIYKYVREYTFEHVTA